MSYRNRDECDFECITRFDAFPRGRGQVVIILPVLVETVNGDFLGHAGQNLFVDCYIAIVEHFILWGSVYESQYDAGDGFPGAVLYEKRLFFDESGFSKPSIMMDWSKEGLLTVPVCPTVRAVGCCSVRSWAAGEERLHRSIIDRTKVCFMGK